jgi:biopolymer transport protein ExbB/TolQ
MSIFLILIAWLGYILFGVLKNAFLYNIQINSVILISLLFGVLFIYVGIFRYRSEYLKLLKYDTLPKSEIAKLRFLRPLSLYISRTNKIVSQAKLQTILSSVESRIDNFSAIPKYVSGVLVFLGLLGTFWGLSHTIGNVANIIDNLGIENSDAAESFAKLKDSLKIPLAGMGIAFGCSLFGLSSSLILGFLNINLKKMADAFFGKVEEWVTKHAISFDAVDNAQEYHGQIFSMGLLEKTIETMYAFQNQLKDLDGDRSNLASMQGETYQKILKLAEILSANQNLVKILSENQLELQNTVKKMSDTFWQEIVDRLTTMNTTLNSIAHHSTTSRDYIVENLGKDIRLVSKTLSALVRDEQ